MFFSDSFYNRSKKRQELLFGLLALSFVVAQLQIVLCTQRNTTMVATVVCICISVGCGMFPGDSSELCLDIKSLPGVGGRLGVDECCQFKLGILART